MIFWKRAIDRMTAAERKLFGMCFIVASPAKYRVAGCFPALKCSPSLDKLLAPSLELNTNANQYSVFNKTRR